MVNLVELGSVLVLALFVTCSRGVRAVEVVAVAAGAWFGEEVCIRVYGAYRYSPAWSVFVDQVPLAVLLIWPAVVLSARAVSRALGVPVFAVVLFDAALVEPIATHAGLWSWSLPGAFGVPPIGPGGWACYAAAVCWLLERAPRWAALGAPLLAHAGILAAWWGALRWVQAEVAPGTAAVASMAACAIVLILALRARRLPWRESIPRAAAAALFAALLAAAPDRALSLYAAPFALPWLAVLDWRAYGRIHAAARASSERADQSRSPRA